MEHIIVKNNFSNPIDINLQVYMQQIRQLAETHIIKHGIPPKFLIHTYGCQMNEHDSEKLTAMLELMGYQSTTEKNEASLILYNTCCVRENAELKVLGNLGSLKPLKMKNPSLMIGVCGCMMQQSHVVDIIKEKYKHVDLIFGTHNLHTFPKLLSKALTEDNVIIDVWDKADGIVEGVPVHRKKDVKGYVNIIYGCNNFCTYCIVPYTRGQIRSRQPSDILAECKTLIDSGVKEITLLGQNVNSYGLELTEPYTFARLLADINNLDGKFRIRFMTPHPKDLSDELISAVATLDKVCEHVHLPIQAGSNTVLKRMNRCYTVENYLSKISKLKSAVPNVAITTDIIIGFPGETESDVDQLIDVINTVDYDSAFTFIYSIRTGTPAAKMSDQIDEDIKHQRFERMLKVLNQNVMAKNASLQGKTFEVLLESKARTQGCLMGRTRQNHSVTVKGDNLRIGQFVDVKITKASGFSIYGEA